MRTTIIEMIPMKYEKRRWVTFINGHFLGFMCTVEYGDSFVIDKPESLGICYAKFIRSRKDA